MCMSVCTHPCAGVCTPADTPHTSHSPTSRGRAAWRQSTCVGAVKAHVGPCPGGLHPPVCTRRSQDRGDLGIASCGPGWVRFVFGLSESLLGLLSTASVLTVGCLGLAGRTAALWNLRVTSLWNRCWWQGPLGVGTELHPPGDTLWPHPYSHWLSEAEQFGLFVWVSWQRQPTPVLLPGKSHGWRSLVGCSPRGR